MRQYKESNSGSDQVYTWATLKNGGWCSLAYTSIPSNSSVSLLWRYQNPGESLQEISQTINWSSSYQYAQLQMTGISTGVYVYTK